MKRQLLSLMALAAMLICITCEAANSRGGGGRGGSHGHGHGPGARSGGGRGFGGGFGLGFGGFGGYGGGYGWDVAELYRQLYDNLPYFALHPPVYYSEPVPRTYGYSPFAYPPGTMTPDVIGEAQPVTINNPYVPATKPTSAEVKPADRSASASKVPEPLVILNPFVTPASSVAKGG